MASGVDFRSLGIITHPEILMLGGSRPDFVIFQTPEVTIKEIKMASEVVFRFRRIIPVLKILILDGIQPCFI